MSNRKPAWPLVVGALVIVAALLLPAALSVEDGSGAPAAASVGMPHVGDVGRYAMRLSGAGYAADGSLFFRWENATTENDAFGIMGPVDRAQVWVAFGHPADGATTRPAPGPASGPTQVLPMTLGFKPGSTSPSTLRTSEFGASLAQGPGVSSANQTDPSRGYTLQFDPTTPNPFTCFLRAPVQGIAYDALALRTIGDFCPGAWGATADARVAPAHETVAGYDALHIHLDGAPANGAPETADLWYGGALPYPLRATFAQGGSTLDLTLTNESLGSTALLAGPAPPVPALRPDGEFAAPADPTAGPAEGQLAALPFPLADAIAHARSDPRGKSTQDFLASHAEARLVAASLAPLASPESGWAWQIAWATPGGESQATEVDRLDGVSPSGLTTVALPQPSYDVKDAKPVASPRFDAATLPKEFLTFGDAAKLFVDTFHTAPADRVEFALFPHATFTLANADDRLVLEAGTGAVKSESVGPTRTTASALPVVSHALGSGSTRGASLTYIPALPPGAARVGGVSVASATALTLLVYYFGAHLVALAARFAALPLFTRLPRGEALANDTRRRVYEAIEADPGIHTNLLRARTGCGNGALLYHLEVLTRERLVARVELGRFTRYFVSGAYSPGEMRTRALLLAGSGQRVFDLVREHPGIRLKELAGLAGLSVPSTHRALARLEAAGIIARERDGRDVTLVAREPERLEV
ncbi:MAG: winged helix-turn-helix transcriptional regulator [Thermoplasmatota archaeon]